jgi:hypothetical protein
MRPVSPNRPSMAYPGSVSLALRDNATSGLRMAALDVHQTFSFHALIAQPFMAAAYGVARARSDHPSDARP